MTGPITRFHESNITAQSIFRKGSIRMVSLWKPKGLNAADQDLMHALFLRVNIVELGEVEKRPN
ncbi:MAG: hypothetical protein P1V20_05955 [Verrucomicrobiales bacterium]|nr:hypothetical protein [Verrucomicrobiales bacterium]